MQIADYAGLRNREIDLGYLTIVDIGAIVEAGDVDKGETDATFNRAI